MQAQPRLSVSGGGGGGGGGGGSETSFEVVAADGGHEAVVRELTRGHELTARLQEQARRALRGQGQAEATAAFILQEVSRAFAVCLSIMAPAGGPAPQPATPESAASGAAATRRPRDDGAPRKRMVTSTPYNDGYQWRKYGQKRIMNTSFPRCYFRCSYHRERSCPATKQVQQRPPRGYGEPPKLYDVVYVHEHTCDALSYEPEQPPLPHGGGAAAAAPRMTTTTDALGFSGAGGIHVLDYGSKAEQERALVVSSLTCVLSSSSYGDGDGGGAAAAGPGTSLQQGVAAAATAFDAPAADHHHLQMPPPTGMGVDEGLELDVTDYDVTDAMFFGTSDQYALRDDDDSDVLY